MSGKIRGHRRRRNTTPYERTKPSWKEWVTPSSWWSYLTGTPAQNGEGSSQGSPPGSAGTSPFQLGNGGQHLEQQRRDVGLQLEQPIQEAGRRLEQPRHDAGLQLEQSGLGGGHQMEIPGGPHKEQSGPVRGSVAVMQMVSESSGEGVSKSGTHPSVPKLASRKLFQVAMPSDSKTGRPDSGSIVQDSDLDLLEESRESELSWIAEASDEEEGEEGKRASERDSSRMPSLLPRTSSTVNELSSGQKFHLSVDPSAFHVKRVPSLAYIPSNSMPVGSIFSSTSGAPGNFNTRLFSTQPLTTSTPQMSPEGIRPSQHGGTAAIQVEPQSNARGLPLHSPFYSGRTAFGGAGSAMKRTRVKRPRTESSPPTMMTVSHSVRARPALPSTTHLHTQQPHAVASQTTKRILAKLRTLSSPLTDARKLPLRLGPREQYSQQPAKRKKTDHPTSSLAYALSPPPVTSFVTSQPHTPRLHMPQMVPNERSLHTTSSGLLEDKAQSSGEPSGPKDRLAFGKSHPPPLNLPSVSPESTTPGFSSLTNLKVSAPPPISIAPTSHTSPPHKERVTTAFAPVFHTSQRLQSSMVRVPTDHPLYNTSHGGLKDKGSMPIVPKDSKGSGGLEDYSGFTKMSNPPPLSLPPFPPKSITSGFSSLANLRFSAPPPSSTPPTSHTSPAHEKEKVTLSVSTAAFAPVFHTLRPSKNPGMSGVLNGVVPLKTDSTHSPFSFTTPKPVGLQQTNLSPAATVAIVKTPQQGEDASFSFSAPKNCTVPPPPITQPSSRRPLSPPYPNGRSATNMIIQPANPPLKNMSVVDALRLPEFQPLGVGKRDVTGKGREAAVVDLTDDDDEETSNLETQTLPPLKPLAGFAPPTGSWSCDTCLIDNKATDGNCIACGAGKPGAIPNTSQAHTAGGIQMGSSGRISLGPGGGMKLTNPLSSMTSTPIGGIQLLASRTTLGREDTKTAKGEEPGFGAAGGLKFGTVGGLKLDGTGGFTLGDTGDSSGGLKSGSAGGLKFCGTGIAFGGLKFGSTEVFQRSGTESSTGRSQFGDTEHLKMGETSTSSKEDKIGGSNLLAKFAPPPGAWSCDVCMVSNKADVMRCVACSTLKSGGEATKPVEVKLDRLPFGKDGGLSFGFKLGTMAATSSALPSSGGFKLSGMPLLKPLRAGSDPMPLSGSMFTSVGGGLQFLRETTVASTSNNGVGEKAAPAAKLGDSGMTSMPKQPQMNTMLASSNFSFVPGGTALQSNRPS